MLPDDPRHGTVAGYNAHRRSGDLNCLPCRRAKMRYEKARLLRGGVLKVPALGTQRRVQALRAMGWALSDITDAAGWVDPRSLQYPLKAKTITAGTAARVAAVYDRLSAMEPTSQRVNRNRRYAKSRGWFPPSAWLDIDDPDEQPDPGWRPRMYRAEELSAEWDHLRRAGVSIHTAAQQLGVTVGAIEKAIERAGRNVA